MKGKLKWLVKAVEKRPVAAVIAALLLGLIAGLCDGVQALALAVRILFV